MDFRLIGPRVWFKLNRQTVLACELCKTRPFRPGHSPFDLVQRQKDDLERMGGIAACNACRSLKDKQLVCPVYPRNIRWKKSQFQQSDQPPRALPEEIGTHAELHTPYYRCSTGFFIFLIEVVFVIYIKIVYNIEI